MEAAKAGNHDESRTAPGGFTRAGSHRNPWIQGSTERRTRVRGMPRSVAINTFCVSRIMRILATQKSGRGLILFGNFVFLGLRKDSGMTQQSDADLYL